MWMTLLWKVGEVYESHGESSGSQLFNYLNFRITENFWLSLTNSFKILNYLIHDPTLLLIQ